MAGGSVALMVIDAQTNPFCYRLYRRIDDIEALSPICFAETVRVVDMRARRSTPYTEQCQLIGR
jgi:hypothetical protein